LQVQTELTAIVEEDLDRTNAEVTFGIAALERSQILVAAVSDLPRIAQRARLELRV
jgi:hypothetical protein